MKRIAEINESVKCSLEFVERYQEEDPQAVLEERLYLDRLKAELEALEA